MEIPQTAPPRSRPAGSSVSWTQFLRSQAAVACDFRTVDTALVRRCYLLFFIDITNREVFCGGITANPTGTWIAQGARNGFVRHPDRFTHTGALVRDRASQFTGDFDEIFRSEGLKILRTPVRVPVANAFAERQTTPRRSHRPVRGRSSDRQPSPATAPTRLGSGAVSPRGDTNRDHLLRGSGGLRATPPRRGSWPCSPARRLLSVFAGAYEQRARRCPLDCGHVALDECGCLNCSQ